MVKSTAISFLRNDVDFQSILALEEYSDIPTPSGERVKNYGKTDIFKQRVLEKEKAPSPKNAKDGIFASIYTFGNINLKWICDKLRENGIQTSETELKEEIIRSVQHSKMLPIQSPAGFRIHNLPVRINAFS